MGVFYIIKAKKLRFFYISKLKLSKSWDYAIISNDYNTDSSQSAYPLFFELSKKGGVGTFLYGFF